MRILIGTKEQIEQLLNVVNQIVQSYLAGLGYTVIDGAVVAKNAATGADNPEALTTTWAIPQPIDPGNEDGDWFIVSPSSDPRFVDWRERIPESIDIQCEEQQWHL